MQQKDFHYTYSREEGQGRRTRPSARRIASQRARQAIYEGNEAEIQRKTEPERLSRSRGTRRRRRKRSSWGKRLLLLVLIAAMGLGLWTFLQPYIGKRYRTLAIFGVDSRNGNVGAGALSDVIMVASIDRRSGAVKLTSVYRDTYSLVDAEAEKYHKLNEAYFLGGPAQAVQALENNLDLQIDDYITFNWSAVAKGITALGGVDLEITEAEFRYMNAFITETVESTGLGSVHLESAGQNHLDGVQAVAYGRLRLMDTDFNRTERQRKILRLAVEKAKQANTRTLADIARYVFPEVSTSMGLDDVLSLAANARKYTLAETRGFPFDRTTQKVGKMDCVIPGTLSSNVTKLHRFLYDTEEFVPSARVKEISDHIQSLTGVGDLGD